MTADPTRSDWRVLVVVPAYNEKDNVAEVVRELQEAGYDVVVVDDGSLDGTASVAARAGAPVLPLPRNLGVGGALRCGFRYAVNEGYDVAVQCDADGQHVAGQIHVLLDAMREHDAHLVVGSRFAGPADFPVNRSRRLAMRILSSVATRRTGVRFTDTTSGFRAIREPLLSAFSRSYPAQYLGDTFEALVGAGSSGYRVVEVPVRMRARASGTSSATPGAAMRYVLRAVLTVFLGSGKRVARQVALPSET